MSNSTVLRILTTFTEVIPAAPNAINTRDIERNLELRGMGTSQSQLSRDLANYAETFGVQECGYGAGGKMWQRISRNGQTKMPEAEIMLLTMLQDQLDYLPSFSKSELMSKLGRMQKQKDILQSTVPNHPLFKWEHNFKLLKRYEKSGYLSKSVAKALAQCLNDNGVLKCVSEKTPDELDFLDTVTISEVEDLLYVSGISRLHGETNYQYLAKEIMSAECIAQCEAYDLFAAAPARAPR